MKKIYLPFFLLISLLFIDKTYACPDSFTIYNPYINSNVVIPLDTTNACNIYDYYENYSITYIAESSFGDSRYFIRFFQDYTDISTSSKPYYASFDSQQTVSISYELGTNIYKGTDGGWSKGIKPTSTNVEFKPESSTMIFATKDIILNGHTFYSVNKIELSFDTTDIKKFDYESNSYIWKISKNFSFSDFDLNLYKYKYSFLLDEDIWSEDTEMLENNFKYDFYKNDVIRFRVFDNSDNVIKTIIYTEQNINYVPFFDIHINENLSRYYEYENNKYLLEPYIFYKLIYYDENTSSLDRQELYDYISDNYRFYFKFPKLEEYFSNIDENGYALQKYCENLTNLNYCNYFPTSSSIAIDENGTFYIKTLDKDNNFINEDSFVIDSINTSYIENMTLPKFEITSSLTGRYNPCDIENYVLLNGYTCGDYFDSFTINYSLNYYLPELYDYEYLFADEFGNVDYAPLDTIVKSGGSKTFKTTKNGTYIFKIIRKSDNSVIQNKAVSTNGIIQKTEVYKIYAESKEYYFENVRNYVENLEMASQDWKKLFNSFYSNLPEEIQSLFVVVYIILLGIGCLYILKGGSE